MKIRSFLLIAGMVLLVCFQTRASSDSLGIKEEDGEKFIMHRVDQGETLFAISKRYGVDVEVLKSTNPQSEKELVVGEVILIPFAEVKPDESSDVFQYHTVQEGQTLFSISQKYDAEVEKIKKWNQLKSNNIEVGQELKVGKENESSSDSSSKKEDQGDTSISEEDDRDDKRKARNKESSKDSNAKKINQKPQNNQASRVDTSGELSEKEGKGKEDSEAEMSEYQEKYVAKEKEIEGEKEGWVTKKQEGKATWISDRNMSTRKSLALHRSAPPGTVIKVKNPQNDKTVYVKTVGLLNDDSNKKTLITISQSAAEKLDVEEDFFRAQLKYTVKKESN